MALAAVAAALVVAGKRLGRFAIAGDSMAPALRDGDWVLARRARKPPERGAVVMFPHPDRPGFTLVKRVVGLPGEAVKTTNGEVLVDGQRLGEPWASGRTGPAGEWVLGPDEVFVLGDNRPSSADDSRALGPVPAASVEWRLVARYWPAKRRPA